MLETIRFEAFYGAMLAKYPSKSPEDVRESARKAWGDADKRKAIEETPKLRNVLDAAVEAYRRVRRWNRKQLRKPCESEMQTWRKNRRKYTEQQYLRSKTPSRILTARKAPLKSNRGAASNEPAT